MLTDEIASNTRKRPNSTRMSIQRIECSGEAYDVGFQHGKHAAEKVKGSIQFYEQMFLEYTGEPWCAITRLSSVFGQNIEAKWPEFYDEMRGVADGAGCSLPDIVALNVRTELAFGLMQPDRLITDGCTSLGWRMPGKSLMSQNWDWMEQQAPHLIFLTIRKSKSPTIKIVTEAGIIGKIGMNANGVAVCLNAVRCTGYDSSRLPVHLSLRMVLECETLDEAVKKLEASSSAGSAFMLIGQGTEMVGLEFTSSTVRHLNVDQKGRIMHTNHLVLQHEQAEEWPEADSMDRLKRICELTEEPATRGGGIDLRNVFDDHSGWPFSICRQETEGCKDATLFSIMMDLNERTAFVKSGRLCEDGEELMFDFNEAASP